jgi:hypothetical protein
MLKKMNLWRKKHLVIYRMFNKPRTVGKIELLWKFPPKEYEILFNGGGAWEPFMEITVTQKEFRAEF